MDVDYRFNPTRGYSTDIQVILGNKKIIPNRVITQLPSFENSYDSLNLKTFQMDLQLSGASYIPVGKWATVKTGVTSGLRYNQDRLPDNELMRIGGYKILRGFDEESLLTSFYAYGTVEFRIILDQNSYITLPFLDWGYVASRENGQLTPVLGAGMGLNVGTKAGIFHVAFAAGRAAPNPLDFGRMKVHFGYVNLF
jgi:hemolysin activation/secretion protein